MDAEIIESEALKLPEAERAILIDHLQSSLSNSNFDFQRASLEESKLRFESYQRGESDAIDGPSFVSELKNRLRP